MLYAKEGMVVADLAAAAGLMTGRAAIAHPESAHLPVLRTRKDCANAILRPRHFSLKLTVNGFARSQIFARNF